MNTNQSVLDVRQDLNQDRYNLMNNSAFAYDFVNIACQRLDDLDLRFSNIESILLRTKKFLGDCGIHFGEKRTRASFDNFVYNHDNDTQNIESKMSRLIITELYWLAAG